MEPDKMTMYNKLLLGIPCVFDAKENAGLFNKQSGGIEDVVDLC